MRSVDDDRTRTETNGFHVIGEVLEPIKRLKGFEKHHFTPPRADDYHNAWVGKIAGEDIQQEIALIHDRAKRVQGWRRKEIATCTDSTGAVLETPAWTYRLCIALDPEKRGHVRWRRSIETPGPISDRTGSEWDLIFPAEFHMLELHPPEPADVRALIDRFEDRGMTVDYPPDGSHCRVALSDPSGHVDVEAHLVRVALDTPNTPGALVLSVGRLVGRKEGPPLFLLR